MKEKVTKSITIEKMVNSDLKEGICTEKNYCKNFLHCKK
jgi:hypothetical protein